MIGKPAHAITMSLLLLACGCSPAPDDQLKADATAKLVVSKDAEISALKKQVETLNARRSQTEKRHASERTQATELASSVPPMCFKDYCPCEGEQGGPDMLLCDRLEAGLPVETDMMIVGRGMREARRQLADQGF